MVWGWDQSEKDGKGPTLAFPIEIRWRPEIDIWTGFGATNLISKNYSSTLYFLLNSISEPYLETFLLFFFINLISLDENRGPLQYSS